MEEGELDARIYVLWAPKVWNKYAHICAMGPKELKVDGIFFDKIYADLMCLLKSRKLNKKYLDMNLHFLELLEYLQHLTTHPRLSLDPDQKVFTSKPRLYGENKLVNHRQHNVPVREKLYTNDDCDEEITFPLIQSSAAEMAQKLKTYKADHPGGRFWSPSTRMREMLMDLEPTNDACESILGLNDWLQKITPNMAQTTVSAMVQTKKNATMPWLMAQSNESQTKVINLTRERAASEKETKEEHRLYRKRQRQMDEEKMKIKKARLQKKKQELAIVKRITSAQLDEALEYVEGRTERLREMEKIEFIKKQLQKSNAITKRKEKDIRRLTQRTRKRFERRGREYRTQASPRC